MTISPETTASVYFKCHLTKHVKVLTFDFSFNSPGFCADGNNMLAGRHTWVSKKLHGLQWRKIKPELRKKMYPECAKRKKNHYHFTKKFISVKRFAVFLFHEKRFYKLRILAHLSNVSCGNRQFSFISQERKKQIICHSRD